MFRETTKSRNAATEKVDMPEIIRQQEDYTRGSAVRDVETDRGPAPLQFVSLKDVRKETKSRRSMELPRYPERKERPCIQRQVFVKNETGELKEITSEDFYPFLEEYCVKNKISLNMMADMLVSFEKMVNKQRKNLDSRKVSATGSYTFNSMDDLLKKIIIKVRGRSWKMNVGNVGQGDSTLIEPLYYKHCMVDLGPGDSALRAFSQKRVLLHTSDYQKERKHIQPILWSEFRGRMDELRQEYGTIVGRDIQQEKEEESEFWGWNPEGRGISQADIQEFFRRKIAFQRFIRQMYRGDYAEKIDCVAFIRFKKNYDDFFRNYEFATEGARRQNNIPLMIALAECWINKQKEESKQGLPFLMPYDIESQAPKNQNKISPTKKLKDKFYIEAETSIPRKETEYNELHFYITPEELMGNFDEWFDKNDITKSFLDNVKNHMEEHNFNQEHIDEYLQRAKEWLRETVKKKIASKTDIDKTRKISVNLPRKKDYLNLIFDFADKTADKVAILKKIGINGNRYYRKERPLLKWLQLKEMNTIITHQHDDHYGTKKEGDVLARGQLDLQENTVDVLRELQEYKLHVVPNTKWLSKSQERKDPNRGSLMFYHENGSCRIYFLGDSPTARINRAILPPPMPIHVLIFPHHGSESAGGDGMRDDLFGTERTLGIVSAGDHNIYKLPSIPQLIPFRKKETRPAAAGEIRIRTREKPRAKITKERLVEAWSTMSIDREPPEGEMGPSPGYVVQVLDSEGKDTVAYLKKWNNV